MANHQAKTHQVSVLKSAEPQDLLQQKCMLHATLEICSFVWALYDSLMKPLLLESDGTSGPKFSTQILHPKFAPEFCTRILPHFFARDHHGQSSTPSVAFVADL